MMLSISSGAEALRRGETTSLRLTQAVLAAADDLDETLGVFLARFDHEALAAAEKADEELASGIDRGPLHGIPLAIKDNIVTRETTALAQSAVRRGGVGNEPDSVVASRLRTGGAIIVGKTTLMEFGIGLPTSSHGFPVPRNPWDISRWSGGSSSGSASGVSAGLFFGALGTDTAGSIRIPAAFCGVTGLKPTFGLVPRDGTIPLGFSYDTVGPIARSARDCAIILTQIAGNHERDGSEPGSALPDFTARLGGTLDGLRLGVHRRERSARDSFADVELREHMDAAVDVLRNLGAEVVNVDIPYYDELTTSTMVGELAEAFAYHRRNLQEHWNLYGRDTRMTLASGSLVSGPDFVQAQRVRRIGQQAVGHLFDTVDAVISATVSGTAPSLPIASFDDLVAQVNTPVWNATGNPAISIPIGFDMNGLPLAMQVAGDLMADPLVLAIADAFQGATEWHSAIPPVGSSRIQDAIGMQTGLTSKSRGRVS
ncbi:amidase [Homoserinimonas sp. OAct 916]|uniref:amidase n=1 Tax=Homoserinimonas sp. OAct 916 TaxID=2211450 RepID=UPI000DBE45FB|nr:amidase [Homoserinimonas sp. OAct 916]